VVPPLWQRQHHIAAPAAQQSNLTCHRRGDTALGPQRTTAGASGAVTGLPPVHLAVQDLRAQFDRFTGAHAAQPADFPKLIRAAGQKELVGKGALLGKPLMRTIAWRRRRCTC
jgi:hypothetical protein